MQSSPWFGGSGAYAPLAKQRGLWSPGPALALECWAVTVIRVAFVTMSSPSTLADYARSFAGSIGGRRLIRMIFFSQSKPPFPGGRGSPPGNKDTYIRALGLSQGVRVSSWWHPCAGLPSLGSQAPCAAGCGYKPSVLDLQEHGLKLRENANQRESSRPARGGAVTAPSESSSESPRDPQQDASSLTRCCWRGVPTAHSRLMTSPALTRALEPQGRGSHPHVTTGVALGQGAEPQSP